MKLYANIIGLKQGKQVIKGQGSNQSLQIEILAENLKGIPTRTNIYRIELNVGNDNELQAEILDYSTGERKSLTKGEKKKDNDIKFHDEPLKCTKRGCNNLQCADGEFCKIHI